MSDTVDWLAYVVERDTSRIEAESSIPIGHHSQGQCIAILRDLLPRHYGALRLQGIVRYPRSKSQAASNHDWTM